MTAAKIKKQTITAAKIKNGTLTGTQINLTKLGTVPTAQLANTIAPAEALAHSGARKRLGHSGWPRAV